MQINTQNLINAIEENISRVQAEPDRDYSRSRIGEVAGLQLQILATRKTEQHMPRFFTHECVSQGESDQEAPGHVVVTRLPVMFDDYANAVEHLMALAEHDTGGSHAAAQVLLGLYNGNTWPVDLTDVACNLDSDHRQSAIVAIMGRGKLMREPHNVIENGQERFYALAEQWAHLRADNRYKKG